MSTFDLKFETVFKVTMTCLHLNRAHPNIPRNIYWMAQFTPILALSILSFLLLGNSFLFHDVQSGNYTEASKNGVMAIVAFTIIVKYVILLYRQKDIKNLIATVNDDYEIAKDFCREEQDIVRKYAQKGVTACKFWLVSTFMTSSIFPIKAFVLMAYYYIYKGEVHLVPMFDMTYPGTMERDKNIIPIFCLLFFLCFLFDCFAGTMYIGFDPLVPIFMLHTCGQLELLSRRIIKLFADNKNPRIIEKELKLIIIKLQGLYRFVDLIKTYFAVLFEYNMKTTTFMMPLTAFQVLEALRRGQLNLEFTSFLTACMLQFYLPCYYSDLLMENNRNFRQAIYSCGWEKQPDKGVRQLILFMMTRASLTLGITTVFYEICLDTFAEMCRQSYAIFNLMNAAWS
ncbi:uncharacterized protein LOC115444073 [Manduca sexta]|uniref:Odorant receptor n=1 Tax=Manduca sexta TaxID=7130 RepID=A0A0P1IW45_MANSE|nr:uncharacterized protein LOC115444073 [Manduca sexta]KAG6450905.1 hypothetical protein O3G_MSEX006830 [Manduca sexta]CUQ99397.1 Olfactory receptor 13 [Manduca sexta]